MDYLEELKRRGKAEIERLEGTLEEQKRATKAEREQQAVKRIEEEKLWAEKAEIRKEAQRLKEIEDRKKKLEEERQRLKAEEEERKRVEELTNLWAAHISFFEELESYLKLRGFPTKGTQSCSSKQIINSLGVSYTTDSHSSSLNFVFDVRSENSQAILRISPADPNHRIRYSVFGVLDNDAFGVDEPQRFGEKVLEGLHIYAEYYRDLDMEEHRLRSLSIENQKQWYENEKRKMEREQRGLDKKRKEVYDLEVKDYHEKWKTYRSNQTKIESWQGRFYLGMALFIESGNPFRLFKLPATLKLMPTYPDRFGPLQESIDNPRRELCPYRKGIYYRPATEVREEIALQKERSRIAWKAHEAETKERMLRRDNYYGYGSGSAESNWKE